MKRFALVALMLAGCAHVDSTRGTFNRGRENDLALRLTRHVDTVVRGPDDEEDHVLVLDVRHWTIGQRLEIPGDVTPVFTVQRFGPSSKGETYRGFLIVRKVEERRVVATLNLVVTAKTEDNTYRQTARFRGTFTFDRQ